MDHVLTAPSRVLVIISTIVVALGLLLASGVQATGDGLNGTIEYEVRSGDTLWDIARDLTPSGYDVRDTVGALRDLNDLDDSMIHPGQMLELPASQ